MMTESPAPVETVGAETAAEVSNKRQHNRIPLEIDIDFASESNFYNGFTENISEGGVFVATYEQKGMGEKVSLKFRLPDSNETIECEGEVRWIREQNADTPDVSPGIGIRFINMSPSVQARVDEFIREREPLFYDD